MKFLMFVGSINQVCFDGTVATTDQFGLSEVSKMSMVVEASRSTGNRDVVDVHTRGRLQA